MSQSSLVREKLFGIVFVFIIVIFVWFFGFNSVLAASLITGAGAGGGPHVRSFTTSGVVETNPDKLMAYAEDYRGGVRIATGDIDSDGVDEIITGTGENGGPHLRVFEKDGTQRGIDFFPFDNSFRGGMDVASGDFDGDGKEDIAVSQFSKGQAWVKVYKYNSARTVLFEKNIFGSPECGATVAMGQLDSDASQELIVGAGTGCDTDVHTYDYNSSNLEGTQKPISIYAFTGGVDEPIRSGVDVAAGDIDGDGKDEIAVSLLKENLPWVRIFRYNSEQTELGVFKAYGDYTIGTNVEMADIDADGLAEVLTGAGPGGGPQIRAFEYDGTVIDTLNNFFAYDENFRGGVDVGVWNPGTQAMTLDEVQYWTYNIQDINTSRQREQLVGSHFDMYVLEPVVTETGEENFAIANLVQDIKQYNIDTRGVEPLVLAYVDIGQTEDWRWYFDNNWEVGDPEWIVSEDPDGWEGCSPVAYWYDTWQDIVINGYQGRSQVEESLRLGFDGIYMDWVEAFSDESVVAKAQVDGVDPANEMFDFINNIRTYARQTSANANPDYLVVAQNASDLYQENPTRYQQVIDAIALEGIWYEGTGGFDSWDDSSGYNTPTNSIYHGYTEEVLGYLEPMKGRLPIFNVEYAQDLGGNNFASQVYNSLSPAHGFIPYASRRSLSQLSTTPYPVGYGVEDY
ncbi:MAG: FG-GAP-like repeat-containing protein [Parcubacteria group bacterium]